MRLIYQPTTIKSSGGVMTEPTNIKHIKIDGSTEHPILDTAGKRGHWDDFFDKDNQNQVGEDFTRGAQEPALDHHVDWDAVFGTQDDSGSS